MKRLVWTGALLLGIVALLAAVVGAQADTAATWNSPALNLSQSTATPSPTPSATPFVTVPWVVNCTDDERVNGYMMLDVCVPGEETYDASRFSNPGYFSGAMSSYAEGIMEKVVANRGLSTAGYVGAVAVMGCEDIGKTAYIRRYGNSGWDGPFLVADCSGRFSVYVNTVVRGWAVEVDYQTAKRFGSAVLPWVDVRIQGNAGGFAGMALRDWYIENVLAFSWTPALSVAVPTPQPAPTATPEPSPTALAAVPVALLVREPVAERGMAFPEAMFWLVAAHFVADFILQSDKMGWEKRPFVGSTWALWLSAHAFTHGVAVGLATGDWRLGVAETATHWIIDFYRSQRLITMGADQAMHLALKVLWAAIAVNL